MLSTVEQATPLLALQTSRRRFHRTAAAPAVTAVPAVPAVPPRRSGPVSTDVPARRSGTASTAAAPRRTGTVSTDVLRIIADPRTPTYVTVYANGRRRYSHWRPIDPVTGTGGCYAALPTAECDELHASGRIILGDPVVDPHRTTYRVSAATRVPATPIRPVPERARAA